MATPEENGRKVLDIYAYFKGREGDALLPNNFVAVAARRRIPISEIQNGIHYASQMRWIEKNSRGFWKLTREGEGQLQDAGW